MKFTPDYTLKLSDGTSVPLLYNTWAYRTYSGRKGMEYEDLANGCLPKVNDNGEVIGSGETLRTKNLPDILLIGAECYCKYNGLAFTYTDLDACLWMDEYGWLNSTEIAEVGKIFVGKLLNIDLNNLKAEKVEEAPKKKKVKAVSR